MKNQPGTMKNHENLLGTMKNQPGTMKNHGNQPKTVIIFRDIRGVTTDLHDTE